MRGKLICFGDLCVDVVAKAQGALGGSDVSLHDLAIRPAGAAVNCTLTAVSEGLEAQRAQGRAAKQMPEPSTQAASAGPFCASAFDVELLGLLGNDEFGHLVRDRLVAAGVGTQHLRTAAGRTGTVICIVNGAGLTNLYSYRGANAQAYGELPRDLIRPEDLLYLSGYSFQATESRVTAEQLLQGVAKCALDPSYQYALHFRERFVATLRNLDFLFPNLEEARLMTGLHSPEECAVALRQFGAKTVIVKLGADGCYVNSDGVASFLSSEFGKAIDTTGAGDAFAGAFLAGILKGQGILQAAERGNLIAGRLVTANR